MTPAEVRGVVFGPAPFGERGYNREVVDAFLDLVTATLAHDGAGSLTARDLHTVRFTQARRGVRGYHPDEVDAFLHRVICTFAAAGAGQPSAVTDGARALSRSRAGRRGTRTAGSPRTGTPWPAARPGSDR
ncbi:DivIVA domain-containing protein [Nocardia higoensis]|uniref:Cell wall synthesis protein Wag31 n=1 Tax=Nocardia higoensis TaxID=228599 RepID=A0ABS0D7G7_9NOCA|nr:DivIVA domain-containing protein [Nocardia higoensis]MBF6354428.1 DivIVA domain-containing protein [Nocardia higoensis]